MSKQIQLLREILRVIRESNGDAEVVYRLLDANTHQLNDSFPEILRRWATDEFEQAQADDVESINDNFFNILWRWVTSRFKSAQADDVESIASNIFTFGSLILQFPRGNKASNVEIGIACCETVLQHYTREARPDEWATTQMNLGTAYWNRIKGDRADHLEKAIDCYQSALQLYTREAYPYDWAQTQMNLGTAYWNRIKGDRADHLEKAIDCYQSALQLYTREAYPYDWARTQMNLGNAYSDRIKGDRADHLEKAIDCYQSALQLYTREAYPYDWARTQMNLGAAYSDRIKGDRADHLEKAIDCYQSALQLYTREAYPYDWARTQMNLGNAYSDRIKGDRADHLEKAIDCYQSALQLYTREAYPYDWARTQMNLGAAYSDRIKGDRADHLEKAIDCYQSALQLYTREAYPYDWARTQMNLGAAYRNRIKGDRADHLEKAIDCYQSALQLYTREAYPYDWARTQMNLGNAYSNRIKGDRADHLEKAIDCYQSALQLYTREAYPYEWALTQMNLGAAYRNRIKGDRAENLENAIDCYQSALQHYTREAYPYDWARTSFYLGAVYQDDNRFNHAYDTYESAITTVELLRGEIISGEESKRKQAEEWNGLYRRMVEVCLELGKDTEAVEYIERSKTRNLVELLFKDELYPKGETSPEDNQKLQQLRNEIAVEKQRLEQARTNKDDNLDDIGDRLNKLRQQREKLISRIIGFKPIRFPEIQNLLDENTAIIEWYLYDDCFRAFVITRNDDKPQIWRSSNEAFEKLENYWDSIYLELYHEDKKRWRHELNDRLQQLPEVLHLDEVISLVPESCKKLILVPHLYLHLLPIHALQLSNGEYLIDKFSDGVSYAPSCQLLKILQETQQRQQRGESLFAIQNPTQDLEFTDIEVEAISTRFNPSYILKHDKATLTAFNQELIADNFKNANWLHFSCHGYFNLKNPAKSALQLAGAATIPSNDTESSRFLKISDDKAIELEKSLTLENIFELTLSNCRLVTLSACESGFTDFSNTSDEYIGLSSGFIHAGAASIVSSLWAVDDFSTAILIIKFYENIQNLTNNISISLNKAQQWFRQVTQQELLQWIDENQYIIADNKSKIKERLEQHYTSQERPFEKPYHWAAFYAVGE